MTKLKLLGYLTLIPLAALWSCSPSNQLASGSRVVYDDLYGGGSTETRIAGTANARNSSLYANQDQYTDYIEEESIDSYYDESYLSSRDVQRAVSDKAGYSAGFQDGYFAGRNLNYGAYWPGASMMNFNMGFRMGMNSAYFMGGPMMGWGGLSRYSMWNSPFMYNSWGYDPFMTGMYGAWGSPYYGYGFGNSYYLSSMMYGMYGGAYGNLYNPWYYNRPVIIGDGSLAGSARTYGPRTNVARTTRVNSGDAYNSGRVANGTTSSARRSNSVGNTTSARRASTSSSVGDSYYARPRSTGNAYGSSNSAARSSNSVRSSNANNGNYYYSAPRSSSSSAGRTGTSSNATPRSNSNSSFGSSSRTYSAPTRSNSNYSQPSSQPSYSAPRSSSGGGSYSAPARSSAPSGGGGRSSGPR